MVERVGDLERPVSRRGDLATRYLNAGMPGRAVELEIASVAIANPERISQHICMARAYLSLCRRSEARAFLNRALADLDAFPNRPLRQQACELAARF